MPATYEDANLVLQLTRWSTEMGLDEAFRTLFGADFDPEEASTDEPAVRKALLFGEVVGTLVKHGVLDRDLVLDLWWVNGGWSRVSRSAVRDRERLGQPKLFENFEALAQAGA